MSVRIVCQPARLSCLFDQISGYSAKIELIDRDLLMPRIPELQIEDASPPIEAAMRAQIEQFGYVFNATKVLGHCPEVAQAATAMGQALDRDGNIEP